jgi:hypothetical protein
MSRLGDFRMAQRRLVIILRKVYQLNHFWNM